MFDRNVLETIQLCANKIISVHLKISSTKCVYKSYLFDMYVCIKMIWHYITYNGWYAIKPNQTKSYIFNIYV